MFRPTKPADTLATVRYSPCMAVLLSYKALALSNRCKRDMDLTLCGKHGRRVPRLLGQEPVLRKSSHGNEAGVTGLSCGLSRTRCLGDDGRVSIVSLYLFACLLIGSLSSSFTEGNSCWILTSCRPHEVISGTNSITSRQ